MTPPGRSFSTDSANETSLVIRHQDFMPGKQYSFEVRAESSFFHGEKSKKAFLAPNDDVLSVGIKGLDKDAVDESSITLKWQAPQSRSAIDHFKVTFKSDNPLAFHDDLIVKNNQVSKEMVKVRVTDLSPNVKYSFRIVAVKDGFEGVPVTIQGTTGGKTLPRPIITGRYQVLQAARNC